MVRLCSIICGTVVGATLLANAPTVHAAQPGTTIVVEVRGVRSGAGHVLVALCAEADFLTDHCAYHASVPAHAGDVLVRVNGVPPGVYAVEAFHDDDDTRKLEHGFLSRPRKGFGFSRDAAMRFGPPRFNEAGFGVGSVPAQVGLTLSYP